MSFFRDRVADLFRAHPNEWLPATAFEAVGGRQGWRTRISDCRTQLGMTIENRVRRLRRFNGPGCYLVSEYRYLPAEIKVEQNA
jgi:hypothetical protein